MYSTILKIITDVCRPFHRTGLPPELEFPEMEYFFFDAGYLGRVARIFRNMPDADSLLTLIGVEATQIAAHANRPHLIYRMEDLSQAFKLVETQCDQGIIVAQRDRHRLEFLLMAFLRQAGLPISAAEASTRVAACIHSSSLPDATEADVARRGISIQHPLFDELCQFDEELKSRQNNSGGLGDVGLRLSDPAHNQGRYNWCTPINCRVFASTGGDGIHYSFLVEDERVTEKSPVVITMPADFGESSIVAESLKAFLSQGLLSGYSWLSDVPTECTEAAEILKELQVRFGLEPRPALDDHINLQHRFLNRLRLPPKVR